MSLATKRIKILYPTTEQDLNTFDNRGMVLLTDTEDEEKSYVEFFNSAKTVLKRSYEEIKTNLDSLKKSRAKLTGRSTRNFRVVYSDRKKELAYEINELYSMTDRIALYVEEGKQPIELNTLQKNRFKEFSGMEFPASPLKGEVVCLVMNPFTLSRTGLTSFEDRLSYTHSLIIDRLLQAYGDLNLTR